MSLLSVGKKLQVVQGIDKYQSLWLRYAMLDFSLEIERVDYVIVYACAVCSRYKFQAFWSLWVWSWRGLAWGLRRPARYLQKLGFGATACLIWTKLEFCHRTFVIGMLYPWQTHCLRIRGFVPGTTTPLDQWSSHFICRPSIVCISRVLQSTAGSSCNLCFI